MNNNKFPVKRRLTAIILIALLCLGIATALYYSQPKKAPVNHFGIGSYGTVTCYNGEGGLSALENSSIVSETAIYTNNQIYDIQGECTVISSIEITASLGAYYQNTSYLWMNWTEALYPSSAHNPYVFLGHQRMILTLYPCWPEAKVVQNNVTTYYPIINGTTYFGIGTNASSLCYES